MEQRPQVRFGFPDVLKVVVLAKNYITYLFQSFFPIFRTKIKDVLQPIRATFSRNFKNVKKLLVG